jgi:hypothetical protein
MKNITVYILSSIVILTSLASCKKTDDLNSKELLTYIKSDYGNNNIPLAFTRTPVSIYGDSTVKFAAYLTRETSVDVSLNIKADESLVSTYNTANKTSFELLPSVNYKIINNTLNVKAGNIASIDSAKIQLVNVKNLTSDKGYLLPISISDLNTSDKGITASTNFKTIYLVVTSKFNNVDASNLSLTGPNLSRVGWTVTTSGSYSGKGVSRVLDGSNSTAWDSDGRMPAWIILDMAASKTVNGFSIVPSYEYRTDDFLAMDVLSSDDGIIWKEQGQYNGTATASSSTAANPDIKTVKFYGPVTARYFKFNITKTTDGSYAGMAELNAK